MRLVLLGFIGLGLIVTDERFDMLDNPRAGLSVLLTPVYWLADTPQRYNFWQDDKLIARQTLLEDNAGLRAEQRILKAKLQKFAALAAENVRLRELLNSSALLDTSVLVAELVSVSPDPRRHEVVLNKGTSDGVFVGQAVLDAQGLMGQVIETGPLISRAMLISDGRHATPVLINRNGVRAIAEGGGLTDEITVRHVAATTDIKAGDLLVTSGLGQRFPVGYPVAVVSSVVHDPGQPFVIVTARPNARLNRSRHVLLAFNETPEAVPEATPETSPDSDSDTDDATEKLSASTAAQVVTP